MIYISHRGNVDGPVKDKENNIDHIQKALNKGFEVEVDVRFNKNKFFKLIVFICQYSNFFVILKVI